MLKQLGLRHFKCFEHLELPLGALTLLAGENSSGKSSVLHALALLHQTFREHEWSTRLMLNGAALRLGTVGDVIDKLEGRRTIGIRILDEDCELQWEFEGDRLEMSMEVKREHSSMAALSGSSAEALRFLSPVSDSEALNKYLLQMRLREMSYLTAERLGPRDSYSLVDPSNRAVVGPKGEHAVGILYNDDEEPVLEGLSIQEVPPTKQRQTEARMRRFFPKCELQVDRIPSANAVTLGLRTSKDTGYHRPVHIGFGLTQVLPIVVAALFARHNGILMIENPEVHLHPAGQAAMGEFLAEVAAAGVQVILETHSDHVLNGVRRAVKGGKLLPDNVAIHFFRLRYRGLGAPSQVQSMEIDSDGGIDSWPRGFFDQFDKDMNYFADWS